MESFLLVSKFLMIGFAIGAWIGFRLNQKQVSTLRGELNAMKFNYRRAYGFHEWFGIYDVESFDSGKTWYAMRTTSDGKRVVEGEAERLFPGLVLENNLFGTKDSATEVVSELNSDKLRMRNINNKAKEHGSIEGLTNFNHPDRGLVKMFVHPQSYCQSLPVLKLQ